MYPNRANVASRATRIPDPASLPLVNSNYERRTSMSGAHSKINNNINLSNNHPTQLESISGKSAPNLHNNNIDSNNSNSSNNSKPIYVPSGTQRRPRTATITRSSNYRSPSTPSSSVAPIVGAEESSRSSLPTGREQTKKIGTQRAGSAGLSTPRTSRSSSRASPTTPTTPTFGSRRSTPPSQISRSQSSVDNLWRASSSTVGGTAASQTSTNVNQRPNWSQLRRSPSLQSLQTTPRSSRYLDPQCPVHGYSSNPSPNYSTLSSSPSSPATNQPLTRRPYLLHSPPPTSTTTSRTHQLHPLRSLHGSSQTLSPVSPVSPSSSSPLGIGNRRTLSNASSADHVRWRVFGSQPLIARSQPIHLHPQWAYTRPFVHLLPQGTTKRGLSSMDSDSASELKPEYVAVHRLDDAQVVRSIDFHPSGEVYAVGSNSRTLRICSYPADHELLHLDAQHVATPPRVLFKFLQVHRGSIYCVGFNASGDLLATGSNDQTVHVVRYNSTTHCPEGDEYKLTMHDGTVRDLCFIDDTSNGSSLLISAGGGNNKIYVTDCETITPFQSLTGHTASVLSLHQWGGASFVSGSADRTIRFWDLRTRGCTAIVSAPLAGSLQSKGPGAPVNVCRVDPTGRLLVSGHSDSTCMLYDIRASRVIQTFKPHHDEIRTISFSPKSYYLLTAGYDARVVLTDLQGDLTLQLPSVCVAEHNDKIVQAKWHPTDFTFVTTSADKTATLWALPQ